jgi:SpoVK/Ycf46/Vps4 family AAA+-type ATPase
MKKDYYTDPSGETVPAKYVKPYDRKRDQIAQRIARLWQDEQARLAKVKAETIALITQLQEAAAGEADVTLGGARGNIQFRSFDGAITVSSERAYRTEFDERLQFAQQLIMEAIAEMTDKVDDADLSEIARRAFQPRKSGNLDMQRIRDLRNYRVQHPKWRKACEIISDCERTVAFRDYIRVAVRTAPDATPETINLDIAKL